jgi:hypothetical protein
LARNAAQILAKHEQLSSRWEALHHLLRIPSLQSFEQARKMGNLTNKQQQQWMGLVLDRQLSASQQQHLPPAEAAGTAACHEGSGASSACLPPDVVHVADDAAATTAAGGSEGAAAAAAAAATAGVRDAEEEDEDEDMDVEAPLVKKSKRETAQLSRFKMVAMVRR